MRKGFTLIELLAVIVILAIIALIATPIVLNIINDAKESATLRSAEFYLKGVETSIASAILKNKNITDNTYNIKDGDICLNDDCTDKLEVEVDGKVPKEGTIIITDGNISGLNITLEEKEIWIDPLTNELAYKLAPGLYDDKDNLIISWNDLVKEYSFDELIQNGGYGDEFGAAAEVIDSIEGATKLVINDGVTKIGKNAFYYCKNLTSVIIPEGVKIIDEFAFSYCEKLTSIILPSTLTSIGSWAFEVSGSLTNIIIPNSVTHIGNAAFGATNLISIIIPEGVTSIEESTFYDCTNLINITIPSSVTFIGVEAFYGCTSLTSIVIPEGVTYIGTAAFDNCANLTTIYYKGTLDAESEPAPWGAPSTTKVIRDF